MAWSKLFLRAGVLLVGILALLPSFFQPMHFVAPWEDGFSYVYPSFTAPDDKGSVYTIDKSLSRITKVNSQGEVLFEIYGGKKAGNSFFYAAELVVDSEGFLFVVNTVLGPQGFATEREEILLFSPEGEYLKTVYSKTYKPEEITNHNVTRGRLVGLSHAGRMVSWFELTDKGVVESRVDTVTWKLQQGLVLEIPSSAAKVSSVVRMDPRHVAYVTKAGEILLKEEGQSPRLLYSGDDNLNGELSVPWWIGRLDDDHMVFTDLTQARFMKLSTTGEASVLVSSADIIQFTGDEYPYIYYTFGRSAEGRISTVNDLGVLVFGSDGKPELLRTNGKFTWLSLLWRWMFWGGLLLVLVGAFLVFRWLFVHAFKRRVPLALKQLLVLLPILIGVMAMISMALVDFLNRQVQNRTQEQLAQLTQVLAQNLDTEALSRVQLQRDIYGSDYEKLRTTLHRSLNFNKDPWNRHLYFALHRIHLENIYTMMYLNESVGTFHPFTYLNDSQGIYWQSVHSGIHTLQTEDPWGTWLLAVAPVKDASGHVVALIEVGRDMYGYNQEILRDLEAVLPLAITGFLVVIVVFILFTWFFLFPLRELKKGVNRISEGQWETDLRVHGHDEVADLTVVFNKMTVYIRNYIQEIMALSKGYRRFVPQQFLTHLNRKDVTEVNLGDQIQQIMTVLFTDIRSFTQISELMSPKENFDFLNRYLGLVGPEVRKHNGFIDKYIGDAIMALYPSKAEDAIETAIGIIFTLAEFNQGQKAAGQPEINIGIGVHTGTLMLGILGEPERFDGSVISDNVNLASRIEGLTKNFNASILVSDVTMEHVENRDRYSHRYLGKVRVKGKLEPIGLYEILDGLPKGEKVAKMSASKPLEEGIKAYQEARFDDAVVHFNKALEFYPQDVPSQMYLSLCKKLEGHDINKPWVGAIVMNSK